MALSLKVNGDTERAYWRSDVIKKRRALAERWYCAGGEVITFPVRGALGVALGLNPMPTIDFSDEERAAVTRAVRRAILEDRFLHAPRFEPLRSALAKLDPASAPKPIAPLPTGPSVGKRRGNVRR